MSSRFFNNQTNLESDACEKLVKDKNNEIMSSYALNDFQYGGDLQRQGYTNSLQETGIYTSNVGLNVDAESDIRNNQKWGKLTSDKCRVSKQLDSSLFVYAPNKASGSRGIHADSVDTHTKLIQGSSTSTRKSLNTISNTADRFMPMVPWVEKRMKKYSDNIDPENVVRGGASTRSAIRNVDYKKRCGF